MATNDIESERDRAAGVLLGLACGDALGRPVEFESTNSIASEYGRVTEMLGDGTHGKPPGTVTDDTELAVCIARSLIATEAFDPADVASRFVEWYESGPFDAGMMTVDALRRLERGAEWDSAGRDVWESRPEGQNAGNGSVMRCAPYAIAFADSPEMVIEVSRTSSAITHADQRCTYGCAVLSRTLAALLTGEDEPLKEALDAVAADAPDELVDALESVLDRVEPEELQSSGYVVHTLQSALYHGLTASTAREAIVDAVNMGRDTDTVGAVTGAVAGARFGADALPDSWLDELTVEEHTHTSGSGRREWVQQWHTDVLDTALREMSEQLTELREADGFEVATLSSDADGEL